MTLPVVHIFPGFEAVGEALALALGRAHEAISIHTFPDGESRVKVVPQMGTAILFAGLDHPNAKLVQVLLAAGALRESGATRVVLVCPYLCYMRQDRAFSPGEAVSQRIVGRMLASAVDRVVTVDPHLHRIATLSEAMPGIEADALSAAPLIGTVIAEDPAFQDVVLIGPDAESRQWVASAAAAKGFDFLVAEKVRNGDRDVTITLPGSEAVSGRPAVIIDDLISSGATVCKCAKLLAAAGAKSIDVMAVHVLADDQALKAMSDTGVRSIRSSDAIAHSTNAFSLVPILAQALQSER